ncbi:MAG: PilT/PilU family type 4a pilus ATPase [Planctomycetota bacterium]|nr:PilT/PilU family type 4a pilus ATPase [Planctomycetota bacterium]MDW8373746.1 PilT/PilU family type 4a pilus ATPase [Planctomycetota bacterium]
MPCDTMSEQPGILRQGGGIDACGVASAATTARMNIRDVLRAMVQLKSSDLFLKVGSPPRVRIDGAVRQLGSVTLTGDDMRAAFQTLLPEHAKEQFKKAHECDASFEDPEIGRFRVNCFMQRGQIGFVLRHVKSEIPDFKALGLPSEQMERLSLQRRGLILVTGITGSGKSTTLAAMIQYMNRNVHRHIITIEDPIEYSYTDDRCLINQREIGIDTRDFKSALRNAMREAPDVILVGEMRDAETVMAAIDAAETGHLVLSTLHTINAQQTMERIINFFPPYQHALVRMQLSLVLQAVISQRLIPRKDGPGRVPGIELMIATPTVRQLLEEGRTPDLGAVIRDSQHFGCMTFNQSLFSLFEKGLISREDALANSDNPEELEMMFRGIQRGSSTQLQPAIKR